MSNIHNPYLLYLVTDDQQSITALERVVREAVAGGVTMVQVREKHGDVREFIQRAQAIKTILQQIYTATGHHIPLIINDRVDVALVVNADGVHLGQTDMPVTLARKLLGNDKLIGLSIETEQQLLDAASLPIDYIGLSAIFATTTKNNLLTYWGIEGLQHAAAISRFPIVAIGGINHSNLTAIMEAGADGVAIVSAISHAEDPRQATKEIAALLSPNLQ
ncbi:thiamine-phosphate pyrophosphorylase [Photobacterium kishitanii]|uniref:Thiamine-phosphate synthase n=1 Tax=Photobacterium kishitanii TaxID=318456 RepID=A0AAX0YZV8_9GAMM|nr:thiamine phosphate synthase [Photobacterium kishitanii]KJG59927.1 thiamine-phosphate pyrophosphorylase [Photobacterium kishitanii]KJG63209.1 thiamine-phosphate pyrophosphorylase [Photobacterium kishitanii]KJG67784.1 thiamine-phosphate pyrophosphorylase [Photobacterium kishitanii]KJG71380.1 thiamine-phosphate pyrophosphorylase [Photobacterium kishitanii]OBU30757.1 thiamine-phosphate diphosphorylase [Photobacterium kishitanii]